MIRFFTLASSSSGNCVYVQYNDEAVLFDCGLSAKMTLSLLENAGLNIKMIRAICITHEHSDHVKGLRVLQKKLQVPVMASYGTLNALTGQLYEIPQHMVIPISGSFFLNTMEIQPFPISHDAAEPFGYRVFTAEGSVGICTDTGVFTNDILNELSGCDCLLLESNHDVKMLEENPQYPAALKKRIAGRHGHLNNEQSAGAAAQLLQNGTKHFLLGHLSPHNNTPDLAYQTVYRELTQKGAVIEKDFTLHVAPQDCLSRVYVRR